MTNFFPSKYVCSFAVAIFVLIAALFVAEKAIARDAGITAAPLAKMFDTNMELIVGREENESIKATSAALEVQLAPTTPGPQLARIRLGKGSAARDVGIATGGNVFSWKVGGTEFMPPQANWFSQYVDDVFQFVLTRKGEGKKRQKAWRFDDPRFLHQGGSYANREVTGATSYHSPALKVEVSDKQMLILSWPQHGHVPDRLRSDVLALTRITATQSDLLRMEVLIFNDGPHTYTHMNLPWGGVRSTLFPLSSLHLTDSEMPLFQDGSAINATDAEGKAVWHSNAMKQKFAVRFPLSVINGRGKRSRVRVRYGLAGGRTAKGRTKRDFSVLAVNANPQFSPGSTLYLRYFLGSSDKKEFEGGLARFTSRLTVARIKNTAQFKSCVSKSNCGSYAYFTDNSNRRAVFSGVAKERSSFSTDLYNGSVEQWFNKGRPVPERFLGYMDQSGFKGLCGAANGSVDIDNDQWHCR